MSSEGGYAAGGDCWGQVPPTATRVDIATPNSVTYQDAYQFDPPGATGGAAPPPYWPWGVTGPNWTLTGQNFSMDIKTSINTTALAAQYTSSGGQIVIVDALQRIISTNVPASIISQLVPGTYIYNLTMFDGSLPPIVVLLMYGYFTVKPGY